MYPIHIKRIYEQADSADEARILIDRVWPRGITKEKAQLTLWMKEIAPSTKLRTWFQHIPERFAEFERRYVTELTNEAVQPELDKLRRMAEKEQVTLLYAARDEVHNHAVVLQRFLEGHYTTR
jgi:uncharacterized protein YeaO (DUF488 family)